MSNTTRRVAVESLESRRLLSAARLGSISGSVFADLDHDGRHEAGEGGVRSAIVFLDLNGDGMFDKKRDLSAVTDKRGGFAFTNLKAGTYRLYELSDGKSVLSAPRAGWFKIVLTAGQNVVRRQFGNVVVSTTSTSGGVIDLNDNDALIHNNNLAQIENFIRTGRNSGAWNGALFKPQPKPMISNDVVVKYTYNGDTDLSGTVDGADYSRIDSTFNNGVIGGWFNGDFDYNGKVDGADYALIDAAFTQLGTIQLGGSGTGTVIRPPKNTTTNAPRTALSAAKEDFTLTQTEKSSWSAKDWLSGNKFGIRTAGVQKVIGADFKREYLRLAKNVG